MPIRNNFNGLLYYCWQQCLVRALYSQVAPKLYSWMNSNRYYVVIRFNFMFKVMCCAIPYFKDDEVFCKWYAISLDNFLQNIPIYFTLMASWPKGLRIFCTYVRRLRRVYNDGVRRSCQFEKRTLNSQITIACNAIKRKVNSRKERSVISVCECESSHPLL